MTSVGEDVETVGPGAAAAEDGVTVPRTFTRLPWDAAAPALGVHPGELATLSHKISQTGVHGLILSDNPNVPQQMEKPTVASPHNGRYSAIKAMTLLQGGRTVEIPMLSEARRRRSRPTAGLHPREMFATGEPMTAESRRLVTGAGGAGGPGRGCRRVRSFLWGW